MVLAAGALCLFKSDGIYTSKSAYKAQFIGAIASPFMGIAWNSWAPPKCSFFAWLAVQNRLWTSDRLAIRGWPHQPVCQLCRCHPETARHILFECRYSRRVWADMAIWLKCPNLLQDIGSGRPTVLDYWKASVASNCSSREGLTTATILITWEIWKERNARVFNNKFIMPSLLVQKIKDEAGNWILAGAKRLANLTD